VASVRWLGGLRGRSLALRPRLATGLPFSLEISLTSTNLIDFAASFLEGIVSRWRST
jgi:hypothetical protein